MDANIRIREMIPSDLQHVGPLYKAMLEETKPEYPLILDIDKELEEFCFFYMRTLRAMASEQIPKTLLALVAVDGGVSKGFVSGGLCSRIVGQPKVYFLGEILYVTPKFRHKGIGEALVRSATEWASANGAGALEVRFTPGSKEHRELSRMGFRSYAGVGVLAGKDFRPIINYPEFKGPRRENEKANSNESRGEVDSQLQSVRLEDPNPHENGPAQVTQINLESKEP